jgi:hypothetical protein
VSNFEDNPFISNNFVSSKRKKQAKFNNWMSLASGGNNQFGLHKGLILRIIVSNYEGNLFINNTVIAIYSKIQTSYLEGQGHL